MEDTDQTTILRLGVINRVTINEDCLIIETMSGQRVPTSYELDTLLDLLRKHFALKNDPIELLIDKKSEKILDLRILNFGVYFSGDAQKIYDFDQIEINRKMVLERYRKEHEGLTEEDFNNKCPYLFDRVEFFRDNPSLLGFSHNLYDSDELTQHMLVGQSIVVQIPFQNRHEMLLKNPFLVKWFDRACFPYKEDAPITPLCLKILDSLKGNTYLVAAHDPLNPHLGEDKFYAVLRTVNGLNRSPVMDPEPNSYTLLDIEPQVSNFFDLLRDAWQMSFPDDDFSFISYLPSASKLIPIHRSDAVRDFFLKVTEKSGISLTLRESIKELSRDHHKYPRTIKESIKINPKDKSNTYPIESNRPSFYTDDEIEGGLSDYLGDNYFD